MADIAKEILYVLKEHSHISDCKRMCVYLIENLPNKDTYSIRKWLIENGFCDDCGGDIVSKTNEELICENCGKNLTNNLFN